MIPDVQFLSKHGLRTGTVQMRCRQPAEYLARQGWSVRVGTVYRNMPKALKAIVFHRVVDDPITRRAMRLAREMGCAVLYDIDDLLFDNTGIAHFNRLTSRNDGWEGQHFRRAMENADYVICSTVYLRDRVASFHPRPVVMRNGLSSALVDLSGSIPPKKAESHDTVTVAYFAGSRHHSEDFAIIQSALLKLLQTYSQTRFLLMGNVHFDKAFYQFGGRFEHRNFVPYEKFMKMLAEADINLAPLDQSTPVSHARSELKYIEAAAFGVPTVASPTQSFKDAINTGSNGVICYDDEWYGALSALVQDRDLRLRLGQEARSSTLRDYGPDKRAKEWNTLLERVCGEFPARSPTWASVSLRARQFVAINLRIVKLKAKSAKRRLVAHA